MGTVAIICIAVIVIAIVIVLTVLVYNQMLLLNEVNKRLLLMTKESIDKERQTQEELQDAIQQLEALSNEQASVNQSPIEEETFNPHNYHDEDLD